MRWRRKEEEREIVGGGRETERRCGGREKRKQKETVGDGRRILSRPGEIPACTGCSGMELPRPGRAREMLCKLDSVHRPR